MTNNELWPVGTWVADTLPDGHRRDIYQVVDNRGGDMAFAGYSNNKTIYSTTRENFTEIPPLPDEEALRKQGYRLTGMAAGCDKTGEGRLFVDMDGITVCGPHTMTSIMFFNGWRWLVERIDTEEESEQRAQDSETNFGTTTDEGDEREMNYKEGCVAIGMARQRLEIEMQNRTYQELLEVAYDAVKQGERLAYKVESLIETLENIVTKPDFTDPESMVSKIWKALANHKGTSNE